MAWGLNRPSPLARLPVIRVSPIPPVLLYLCPSPSSLRPSIMEDIAFHSYSTPTSIRAQAMPVALSGRDLLCCAETGWGKTAAFTVPMIQHCLAQPPICRGDGPLGFGTASRRELTQQIGKEKLRGYMLKQGGCIEGFQGVMVLMEYPETFQTVK